MTYRLIHVTRLWYGERTGEPREETCSYRDVEAVVRWLERPSHPYPTDYEQWVDGVLRTEEFNWDIGRDFSIRHEVRGADERSQEALMEACRRLGLPVPGGASCGVEDVEE